MYGLYIVLESRAETWIGAQFLKVKARLFGIAETYAERTLWVEVLTMAVEYFMQ